jgi:hypothetical protein
MMIERSRIDRAREFSQMVVDRESRGGMINKDSLNAAQVLLAVTEPSEPDYADEESYVDEESNT